MAGTGGKGRRIVPSHVGAAVPRPPFRPRFFLYRCACPGGVPRRVARQAALAAGVRLRDFQGLCLGGENLARAHGVLIPCPCAACEPAMDRLRSSADAAGPFLIGPRGLAALPASAMLAARFATAPNLPGAVRRQPGVRPGVSHRDFLHLGSSETVPPGGAEAREAIPAIENERCRGERCGHCALGCPAGAIRFVQDVAHIDPVSCTRCGLCLATCPTGAVEFPGHTVQAHLAGLRGLHRLFGVPPPLAIIVDRPERWPMLRGTVPYPLLCAGTLHWTLLVLALTLGFPSVRVIMGPCAHGVPPEHLSRELGRARAVARSFGADPSAITLSPPARNPPAVFLGGSASFPAPPEDARASLDLAASYAPAGSGDRVPDPDSPFGWLRLDRNRCSICTACAATCWSDAITVGDARSTRSPSLRFHPGRCDACRGCAEACPEHALEVVRGPWPAARDGIDLMTATESPCPRCGRPSLPAEALAAIRRRLERDGIAPAGLSLIELCVECRQTAHDAVVGAPPMTVPAR